MISLLEDYEEQLVLLINSGEYDDELINELGISYIKEYRMQLSGLPYPVLYLGDLEPLIVEFRKKIYDVTKEVLERVI